MTAKKRTPKVTARVTSLVTQKQKDETGTVHGDALEAPRETTHTRIQSDGVRSVEREP